MLFPTINHTLCRIKTMAYFEQAPSSVVFESSSAVAIPAKKSIATPALHDFTDDLDFDTLLSFESTFYDTGYAQGRRDGLRQSQFESRVFGVEQGYMKGVALGKLMARGGMWKARLDIARRQGEEPLQRQSRRDGDPKSSATARAGDTVAGSLEHARTAGVEGEEVLEIDLPPLQANERLQKTLEKHVEKMLIYVDPSTLSPANTDDDVAEFDDRLKKAQAKVKVIERLVGEDASAPDVRNQGAQMSNDIENPRINKIAEF
jgi:hypothetical protein